MIHRRTNPFIAIEGTDGSGKTTVSISIANHIGGIYYKSPGGPFAKIRSEVDDVVDPITRFYFYRAAIQYDSLTITELLKTSPVVVDRYYDSTNIIHTLMDKRVEKLINNANLIKPDFVIVLSAERKICLQRLAERKVLKKEELDEKLQQLIASKFITLGYPVVDTSYTTVEEATQKALEYLHKEKKYVKKS